MTRRHVLQWVVGMTASVLAGPEPIRPGCFLETSYAAEPRQPGQSMTIEAWMKEWMSAFRAPWGMLKISRFREPIYFLTAPSSWTPNSGQEHYDAVTVPPGFVTDFASIPRIFWSILRPDGVYAYAAVIHDYLYWTQTRSREESDDILKMAMEDFDVDRVTIGAIYEAVRLGGQTSWSENAGKKAQGEKRILARFPQDPRTRWEDWKKRPEVFDP